MFTRSTGNFLHITTNAFVSVVVIFNDLLCFLTANSDPLRQTPWFNGVSDCKVHYLRKPARLFELFAGSRSKYEARSTRVNVFAFLKCLEHHCILRYMGQQSKLQL